MLKDKAGREEMGGLREEQGVHLVPSRVSLLGSGHENTVQKMFWILAWNTEWDGAVNETEGQIHGSRKVFSVLREDLSERMPPHWCLYSSVEICVPISVFATADPSLGQLGKLHGKELCSEATGLSDSVGMSRVFVSYPVLAKFVQ